MKICIDYWEALLHADRTAVSIDSWDRLLPGRTLSDTQEWDEVVIEIDDDGVIRRTTAARLYQRLKQAGISIGIAELMQSVSLRYDRLDEPTVVGCETLIQGYVFDERHLYRDSLSCLIAAFESAFHNGQVQFAEIPEQRAA